MPRRVLVLGMAIATFALILVPKPALACSCFQGDPRDMLEDADGAMVGEFVSSRPGEAPTGSSADDTIYTFNVVEDVKGEFDATLEVHSAADGASCGLEVTPSQEYGLFLYRDEADSRWESNLCLEIAPDDLREAAAPLPEPDGQGPVAMLVGGSFGDKRLIALDSQGRTLGYGPGDGDVYQLSACPHGKRSVEIVSRFPESDAIAIRELSDLEVDKEFDFGIDLSRESVRLLECDNQLAEKIYISLKAHEGNGRLLKVDGRKATILYEGKGTVVAVGPEWAYIVENKEHVLSRIHLETLAMEEVMTIDGRFGSVAVSPSGKGVAALVFGERQEQDVNLLVIDGRTDPATVRTRRINKDGTFIGVVQWMGEKEILVSGPIGRAGARIYTRGLKEKGRFGWQSEDAAVVGNSVFGAPYGTLERAPLPGGPSTQVREFPSPVTYSLEAVPS